MKTTGRLLGCQRVRLIDLLRYLVAMNDWLIPSELI
jgi:hypothetical protein